MKKIVVIIVGYLLSISTVFAQSTIPHILFIGNSYTHSNDMPQIFKQVAKSMNKDFTYGQNTIGGASLKLHATNNSTMNLIRKGNWNYVFLQGFSRDFAYTDSVMAIDVLPFANAIIDSIQKYNAKAKIILYMTWGYKFGYEPECTASKRLCTYFEMQKVITKNYITLAKQRNVWVAPVGEAWKKVISLYPDLELYTQDFSHPKFIGSYAAACVFHTMIFNEEVTSNYKAHLDLNDIKKVQKAASETVLQYPHLWKNTMSISEIFENEVYMYPMPAKDKLTIDMLNQYNGVIDIELYSTNQDLLLSKKSITFPYTLNVSMFPKGTYFIKVFIGDTAVIKQLILL